MTRLPGGLTAEALAAAENEQDPESLAASVRLRKRFAPDLAATAVTQVVLRRRAVAKFGAAAGVMFFTRDGLEQATRPEVAAHRAAQLAASGVSRLVDLGCGLGTDAIAFLRAGIPVVAVERDPATAEVAQANLTASGLDDWSVLTGDAEELWPTLAEPGTAVFCDPARRTQRGRSWRVEDLSPSWPFVLDLLSGPRPAAVKLGPGLSRQLIPASVEADWLSSRGDTVELTLWAGAGAEPGRRAAVVVESSSTLVTDATMQAPVVDRPRRYLIEPLGAVVRSGGVPTLAAALSAAVLHPDIAYLTADDPGSSPFAARFAVREVFAYRERTLREWVHRNGIGTIEIKTRGLGVDPAALRPRLKPRGPSSATVVLTRTLDGPTVLVIDRQEPGVPPARGRDGPYSPHP